MSDLEEWRAEKVTVLEMLPLYKSHFITAHPACNSELLFYTNVLQPSDMEMKWVKQVLLNESDKVTLSISTSSLDSLLFYVLV